MPLHFCDFFAAGSPGRQVSQSNQHYVVFQVINIKFQNIKYIVIVSLYIKRTNR